MKELTRFFLEMVRIMIFLCVGIGVLSFIENIIWEWLGIEGHSIHFLLPTIANIIFLFVFYRNYLQVKGWYSSKKNQPLGNRLSVVMVLIAFILLISAAFVEETKEVTISQNEVIQRYERITNIERFHHFIERYQSKLEDRIRIVSYTLEGAPIYHDVTTSGNQIVLVVDTSKDPWSGGNDILKVTCNGINKESSSIGKVSYILTDCVTQTGETGPFELLSYSQYRHVTNSLQNTSWDIEQIMSLLGMK